MLMAYEGVVKIFSEKSLLSISLDVTLFFNISRDLRLGRVNL